MASSQPEISGAKVQVAPRHGVEAAIAKNTPNNSEAKATDELLHAEALVTLEGESPVWKKFFCFLTQTEDQTVAAELKNVGRDLERLGIQQESDFDRYRIQGILHLLLRRPLSASSEGALAQLFDHSRVPLSSLAVAETWFNTSIIGCGLNLKSKLTRTHRVLKLEGSSSFPSQAAAMCSLLFVLPGGLTISRTLRWQYSMEIFTTEELRVASRLKRLELSFPVNYRLVEVPAEAGFSLEKDGTCSFLAELQLLDMRCRPEAATTFFEEAVAALPDDFDESSRQAYEAFLQQCGHVVIVRARGGGSVSVKGLKATSSRGRENTEQDRLACRKVLQEFFDEIPSSGDAKAAEDWERRGLLGGDWLLSELLHTVGWRFRSLAWAGGDPLLHTNDVNSSALRKWKASLANNLAVLTDDLNCVPIYDVVKLVSASKAGACEKAVLWSMDADQQNEAQEAKKAMEKELQEEKRKTQEVKKEKLQFQQTNAKIRSEEEEVKKEVEQLQQAKEKVRSLKEETKTEEKRLQQTTAIISSAQKELKKEELQLQQTKAKVSSVEEELKKEELQLQQTKAKVSSVEEEVKKEKLQLQQTNAKIRSEEEEVKKAVEQLQQAKEKVRSLKEETKKEEKRLQQTTAIISSAQKETKKEEERLQQTTSKISSAQKELEKTTKDAKMHEARQQRAVQEVVSLREDAKMHEVRKQRALQDVVSLMEEVNLKKAENLRFDAVISAALEELQEEDSEESEDDDSEDSGDED